jgi:hypothetical protein
VAVPHFSVSIVARGSGRSAVLSAAYRHCAKMDYEREARTIDYTRKQGLLHEEFVIPADAPDWLRSMIADRSVSGAAEAFWNKVEAFEKRVGCAARQGRDHRAADRAFGRAEHRADAGVRREHITRRAWSRTGSITTPRAIRMSI